MYEDPEESPSEDASDPKVRANEKSDEFRMHAELAAVFEGPRKFEAQIVPTLDSGLAREIQRGMARLEKAKTPESPILLPPSIPDAASLLDFFAANNLSTNDYHIHHRPGEVMMVRWLAGDQVESFYERIQAHYDAAMEGYREDERQANEWKQDPKTLAYLDAMDKLEVKMAERYLRDYIRKHNLYVLSTHTADEINIAYLADHIMNTPAAEVVGEASAPPDAPTDQDLAWFFKLFSLRGMKEGEERMCFFTYLQKTDDSGW
jgi:hypothetical protein